MQNLTRLVKQRDDEWRWNGKEQIDGGPVLQVQLWQDRHCCDIKYLGTTVSHVIIHSNLKLQRNVENIDF